MRRELLRTGVARIAHALRPWVSSAKRGPTSTALEVARNVMAVLSVDPELDAADVVESALRHRIAQGWIACGDVRAAARCAETAWLKLGAIELRRAAA